MLHLGQGWRARLAECLGLEKEEVCGAIVSPELSLGSAGDMAPRLELGAVRDHIT